VKGAIIAVAFTILVFFAAGTFAGPPTEVEKWQPPTNGVLPDEQAAINVARAIWRATNPDMKHEIGREESWQSEMVAKLRDGVWKISEK